MIGIVVVSHSEKLAQGIVEFASHMAPNANIVPAGGLDNGDFGISVRKIKSAIEQASKDGDGAIVLVDIGSSVFFTKQALSELKSNAVMVDCPLTEGAIVAAVEAQNGSEMNRMIQEVQSAKMIPKW